MDGALAVTDVCADSSQTVLEHHRPFQKEKNQWKKYVLSDLKCKKYLEDFQKRFVLVPAD